MQSYPSNGIQSNALLSSNGFNSNSIQANSNHAHELTKVKIEDRDLSKRTTDGVGEGRGGAAATRRKFETAEDQSTATEIDRRSGILV